MNEININQIISFFNSTAIAQKSSI